MHMGWPCTENWVEKGEKQRNQSYLGNLLVTESLATSFHAASLPLFSGHLSHRNVFLQHLELLSKAGNAVFPQVSGPHCVHLSAVFNLFQKTSAPGTPISNINRSALTGRESEM